jgi:DnaJ-class molecular chaperone
MKCNDCEGSCVKGGNYPYPCPTCNGTGVEPIKEVCEVNINIDELYLKWSGESHLEKSGVDSYNSSQVQDFGEFCIGEYRKWINNKPIKVKE